MTSPASSLPPKLYACLSYRDPRAAIDFLQRAFGFSALQVVPADDGGITHAELSLGSEVIMLGSAKPDLGWVSPLDLPAINMSICIYVPDPDAHFARAVAAGATVVRAPYDTPYGAREYSVRDIERHEWHFGTYRPVAHDGGAGGASA
jgi:uncharacterized glyoxalase superfamily protein PhnB